MKRAIALLLAAVVLATVAAADDAWKGKPYQQWDIRDVQKILNDSPWVRFVQVKVSWRRAGATDGVPVDMRGAPPGNYGAQGSSGSGGAVGGTGTGNSYGGVPSGGGPTNTNSGSINQNSAILNSAKTPEAGFMIRWFSARVVRQALERAQVLSGGLTESDAKKALTDEPAEYAIAVAGQGMAPFLKAEPMDLAGKAYLQPKKENKISAARVVIQQVNGGKPDDPHSIAAVVFYFAQKTAAGERVLSRNVKSVEFACESGGATIKASFDLSKMAGANGPDW